jgi:hypothetical protein
MNIFNPYYWLFYIVYKSTKLTTKKELQHIVPSSSVNVFMIGLINYYISFVIYSKILNFFPENIYQFLIILSILPLGLFFLNKFLFFKDEKYKKIEIFFDKNNNLTKVHFIVILFFYLFGSVGALVWAGINYKS